MKTLFTRSLVLAFLLNAYYLASANPDTIQVVFHVLHRGGAENISDAQILDAVRILNDDFNKRNSDTSQVIPAFQNSIGNAEIEFQLATTDPQGNPTTGIDRIYTTFVTPNNVDSFYLNQWDQSRYLNIWTAKVGAVQPYPVLSPASADSFPERDGVVIRPNYLGSIGTGSSTVSRALTHEVGHFLNLMHLWGNTNNPGITCGDDSVSDTPITKGFTSCPSDSNAMICTAGVIENYQNFMEFSYCSKMFTQGQVTRMKDCLNSNVGNRNSLRSSHVTGINPLVNTKVVSVLPNPFNSTIRINGIPEGSYTISVFDITGREVKAFANIYAADNFLNLDLTSVTTKGIYVLKVTDSNRGSYALKLVRE